ISESAVSLLDDDELEGVLAHEIGHLQRKDSIKKAIATAYKFAFPFDLLARLVEAAVYREREFSADEYAARLTGKPASLASALLKIHEFMKGSRFISSTITLSTLIDGRKWGIFSKQPRLAERIEKLLRLDNELVN
ncbi:MAG: M48 family metallopeptidase, partial [Rhabdochlamydiaceae bacterium]